jgi:hypothetical protein
MSQIHTVTRGRHLNAARDITTTRLEPIMPATGSYVLVALSYQCLAGILVVSYSPGLGNPRPGHTTPALLRSFLEHGQGYRTKAMPSLG